MIHCSIHHQIGTQGHPPKKVPTFANYLVPGGAAVDGAPGTFPQVILTRHTDLPAMPFQTIAPRPRRRRWRQSAPTPIQLSRAQGSLESAAHAHQRRDKNSYSGKPTSLRIV